MHVAELDAHAVGAESHADQKEDKQKRQAEPVARLADEHARNQQRGADKQNVFSGDILHRGSSEEIFYNYSVTKLTFLTQ